MQFLEGITRYAMIFFPPVSYSLDVPLPIDKSLAVDMDRSSAEVATIQ
jgi:hypothetical protein